MIDKRIYTIFCILLLFVVMSCTTQAPIPTETIPAEKEAAEVVPPIQEEKEVADEEIVELPAKSLDEEELKEAEIDISALIEELNNLIAARDFSSWQKHLSFDYIAYYSDPDVLKEQSDSPLLVKNKIVLRTLEDYFNYIVVGSRQNVRLDEIKAIDRNRINAYMIISGTPWIIYELIRIDNVWKIGKFLE